VSAAASRIKTNGAAQYWPASNEIEYQEASTTVSSHVESSDEEPLGNVVLTDGDLTTVATASPTSDTDGAVEHDTAEESAEIDDAIEAIAEAGDVTAAAEGEPAEEVEVDPAEELRSALKRAAGDWYVVHSYAGYENKVKTNLETRIKSLDMEEFIYQIEVPTEEVTEIKNGQRKQVQRKVYPGYILVRMELTDGSWSAVRNTPGVTGFVGATAQRPSALSVDEVVKILTPVAPPQVRGCHHRRRQRTHSHRGGLLGRRVGHRHGRPFRDLACNHQRGQRRRPEAQGAGVHLRPRDTRRAVVHAGCQDLIQASRFPDRPGPY